MFTTFQRRLVGDNSWCRVRHGVDVARLIEHDFHGIINRIAIVNFVQQLSPIRTQIGYTGNDTVGMLMPLKGSLSHADPSRNSAFSIDTFQTA